MKITILGDSWTKWMNIENSETTNFSHGSSSSCLCTESDTTIGNITKTKTQVQGQNKYWSEFGLMENFWLNIFKNQG